MKLKWLVSSASFVAPYSQVIAQQRAANDFARRYEEFARLIGCDVVQDEIVVHTEKQATVLRNWWRDNA